MKTIQFEYLLDIENIRDQYPHIICKKCQNPAVYPVFCSECYTVTCNCCTGESKDGDCCLGKNLIGSDITSLPINGKGLVNQPLENLEVKCAENLKHGCQWTGPRKDYLDHVKECELIYKPCVFGCEEIININDPSHLQNCEKFKVWLNSSAHESDYEKQVAANFMFLHHKIVILSGYICEANQKIDNNVELEKKYENLNIKYENLREDLEKMYEKLREDLEKKYEDLVKTVKNIGEETSRLTGKEQQKIVPIGKDNRVSFVRRIYATPSRVFKISELMERETCVCQVELPKVNALWELSLSLRVPVSDNKMFLTTLRPFIDGKEINCNHFYGGHGELETSVQGKNLISFYPECFSFIKKGTCIYVEIENYKNHEIDLSEYPIVITFKKLIEKSDN